jgi:hypothetical protein
MKTERFEMLMYRRRDRIVQILGTKAKEYATGEDRLHNFKVAARMAGVTPEEARMGMDLKHRVCIEDMVKGRIPLTREMIDEKLGDHINYMVLLEALLIERLEDGVEPADLHTSEPALGVPDVPTHAVKAPKRREAKAKAKAKAKTPKRKKAKRNN